MLAQRPYGSLADYLCISVIIASILLAPLFGSVSSALIFAFAIFGGIVILVQGRLPALPRPVMLSAAAFAAFFAAEFLSGAVHWFGWVTFGEIGENIAFLGLIPCYMLISPSREKLFDALRLAAPWCAFAVFALAAYQRYGIDLRPQGGAGNAGVFAVTVAIVLSFTLVNLFTERRPRWIIIAVAGVLAAAAALVLTGTRAQWPCLLLFPLILWYAAGRSGGVSWRAALLGLGAVAIVAVALSGTLAQAWRGAERDIAAAQHGNYQTRLGKRFVIWQVGGEAAVERPILGHGLDAPHRIMAERTSSIAGKEIAFSHFHNVVLNEMVRAGIAGTIALAAMLGVPLFLAARAHKDRVGTLGFGLLICFQSAFVFAGAVNIMLDHDIMDSQFLANTVLCLYLVFGKGDERTGSREMTASRPRASTATA